MLAVIVEEQRLGATLALVVTGARSDRVDIAPIFLLLRMNVGVAIDLAGRGLKDLGLHALGQAQHVDCTVDRRLGCLDRISLIMDGRGWTGEVEYLVDFDIERERHVVTHQFETLVVDQVLDVAPRARVEIVDAENLASAREQRFAEEGAEKAGPAGD